MLKRRNIIRIVAGREPHWRELLFWTLLVAAFQSLEAGEMRRHIIGVAVTLAFLALAISSVGKLNGLGLEFTGWSQIGVRAVAVSLATGLLSGGTILMVALRCHQRLGAERGWNQVILAVILGPVIEEVVFRGYLLTGALLLERHASNNDRHWPSVVGVALVFMFAHRAQAGTTWIQLGCIMLTGTVYGLIRLRFQSTVASVLAHGCYNLVLYLSVWIGISS